MKGAARKVHSTLPAPYDQALGKALASVTLRFLLWKWKIVFQIARDKFQDEISPSGFQQPQSDPHTLDQLRRSKTARSSEKGPWEWA